MRLTLFTALMLAAVPALAAPLDAPPAFTGKAVEAQPVTEPAAKTPAAGHFVRSIMHSRALPHHARAQ